MFNLAEVLQGLKVMNKKKRGTATKSAIVQ